MESSKDFFSVDIPESQIGKNIHNMTQGVLSWSWLVQACLKESFVVFLV
jgi:hypothetical protein